MLSGPADSPMAFSNPYFRRNVYFQPIIRPTQKQVQYKIPTPPAQCFVFRTKNIIFGRCGGQTGWNEL